MTAMKMNEGQEGGSSPTGNGASSSANPSVSSKSHTVVTQLSALAEEDDPTSGTVSEGKSYAYSPRKSSIKFSIHLSCNFLILVEPWCGVELGLEL